MARGAEAKKEVINRLLSTFEGSFLYNDGKEVRIPIIENEELIQIKVSLTAAKENVEQGSENILPGENFVTHSTTKPVFSEEETKTIEPTVEEKQNVRDLLDALGL